MSATYPSFTVTRKGEEVTFTSAFATLADAFHSLDAHAQKSEFATSLLQAARERRLSQRQIAWLHKLATDGARPSRDTAPGLNLLAIVELMQHAFDAGKKFPRIVIGDVVLKRAGSKSKHPGTINILVGDDYCGRIHQDGTVERTRGWDSNPTMQARLAALAADPAKVTAQHGVATGTCCYCSRELTDKRSRSVGYGPICADKFGLPWGDTTAADAADAAAKAEPTRRTMTVEEAIEEVSERALRDREEFLQHVTVARNVDHGRAAWRSRAPWRRDIGETYSKRELAR